MSRLFLFSSAAALACGTASAHGTDTASADLARAAENPAGTADADGQTIVVTGQRQSGYKPNSATTATKIDAPLRDIPQTVNVVTQQALQDQRALSIQDVLKNVPGVGFSSGDGQRDQVSIRGFTAIADQFVDGLRDDALYFRDLSNIERVEIIKGPASVLYGRGSSGGLVNRVRKVPGDNHASVIGNYGSFDDRRGEFDVGLAGKFASARLTGAIENATAIATTSSWTARRSLPPSCSIPPQA